MARNQKSWSTTHGIVLVKKQNVQKTKVDALNVYCITQKISRWNVDLLLYKEVVWVGSTCVHKHALLADVQYCNMPRSVAVYSFVYDRQITPPDLAWKEESKRIGTKRGVGIITCICMPARCLFTPHLKDSHKNWGREFNLSLKCYQTYNSRWNTAYGKKLFLLQCFLSHSYINIYV